MSRNTFKTMEFDSDGICKNAISNNIVVGNIGDILNKGFNIKNETKENVGKAGLAALLGATSGVIFADKKERTEDAAEGALSEAVGQLATRGKRR